MKRTQRERTKQPDGKPRAIDPSRLTIVRGGRDLGITIQPVARFIPGMEMQHNETLISLEPFDRHK